MELLDRFLNYVKIPTASDSRSKTSPSTNSQFLLANLLYDELKDLGIDDIYYDKEKCYIYAVLKGNEKYDKVGFISHMDTAEDAASDKIISVLHYDYDGSLIKLENEVIIDPKLYPGLKEKIGKTIITSDGTSLLGADDKAGIAEIMNMLEYFSKNDCEHGDIYVCFTSDEEIGSGVKNFSYERFPVDYAYTVDGYAAGEISYNNFNAATVYIEIEGISAHCGTAKGKMVNALRVAQELDYMLPNERPENTEGDEGFYHLYHINGSHSNASMDYLIRDFNYNNFNERKKVLENIVGELSKKYGIKIKINIEDAYYNMYEVIKDNFHIIENALVATEKVGVEVKQVLTRGGTDGTRLSSNGIPCPNLGVGGDAFHSVHEFVCYEDMQAESKILIEIVKGAKKIRKNL